MSGSAYEHSFGTMPNETVYHDHLNNINYREDVLCKAFQQGIVNVKALTSTTGGAGTAGYALVPVFVDPRIVDLSRKFTPLVEIIPRRSNQGLTADYNIITAKGAAFTALEDAALTEKNDTYDRQSKPIKYLYSVGRVTGVALAAIPSYMLAGFQATGSGIGGTNPFADAGAPNALQLEILTKARALKELEENLILNGDSSSDPTEFDGLIKQQGTTNQLDKSGIALEWGDIEDVVKYAFDDGGRPKIAVGSSAAVNSVRKILIDTFRYAPPTTELFAGVPAFIVLETMVGRIPLIPSQFINSAQTSGEDQIWFFDTDVIEMRVLQDMTFEELAKANDSRKFMLKIYECIINRAPQFSSYIDNILA